jgi:citrate lyase beta subunit
VLRLRPRVVRVNGADTRWFADDLAAAAELELEADGLAWARRVVDAFEQGEREGRGAVALDGETIDLPVVERARRIMAEAKGGAHGH